MPDYPVRSGCVLGGTHYGPGDTASLDAKAAAPLLALGTLGEPREKPQPPASPQPGQPGPQQQQAGKVRRRDDGGG